MKKNYISFLRRVVVMAALLFAALVPATAQSRRPIDSRHPLWMIHIDVWNNADPQKIIDLIPEDVRPYVCFNLSMSCQYDTDLDIYKKPQSAVQTYKSWGSICSANNVWFSCQPASGGHTHIQDDDLATFEYFFKHYKNFLGWNYAEQFWGFDEPGDESSSSQADRLALFAKLVPMHHEYGGFLTISFCGNIWSHGLNPVGMMKRNRDLLKACQEYPEACLWLYKYTTSSCWYNNESVTIAPFISGLATNYGVRYDNCGWNGALESVFGKDNGKTYPNACGYGPVLEQNCMNGGAVWDGPELIWTEDFKEIGRTTVNGYTRRNWTTYAGFDNGWLDIFRKIIAGEIYIPTREETVGRTKLAIINDMATGSDEDKYAATGSLYDGLYKQTDPFNKNNGQWMDNMCFFKKTGRYQTIPVVINCYDELSKAIPTKVKKSAMNTRWNTQTKKVNEFNKLYPKISDGDLFVARHNNLLVTYYPFTYATARKSASATIPLQYNTCETLELRYGKFGTGVINEYADHIDFYLNNYRMDSTAQVVDTIRLHGAKAKPTFTSAKRVKATLTAPTEDWDEANGIYTLLVKHMGPVDITISCEGNATERATNYNVATPLELPVQPEEYHGEIIREAEDMDYRNIGACVTDQFNDGWGAYRSIRGHSAMGFMKMGTSTTGSLRDSMNIKYPGKYTISVRYMSTAKSGTLTARLNGTNRSLTIAKTANNEWKEASFEAEMIEGKNCLVLNNTRGIDMYIDKVTYTPGDMPTVSYSINLLQTAGGTATASATEAEKGTVVTLTAEPDEGYSFDGWVVVYGNAEIIDNQFTMPDCDVTIKPVFTDMTHVYALDFSNSASGDIPVGWRATQGGNEVHSYPNTYGAGARVFSGFEGYQGRAFYWREVSAEYGCLKGYELNLQPAKYILTFASAAWKESPKYQVQVLNAKGTAIAESPVCDATPNAKGSQSADISSAVAYTLEFEVKEAGNHIIRFNNASGGFSEFLLLECRVGLDPSYVGVIDMAGNDAAKGRPQAIFGIDGISRSGLQPGINIVRMADGTAKKVLVK